MLTVRNGTSDARIGFRAHALALAIATAGLAALAAGTSEVQAQAGQAARSGGIEEVTVTARRREESLQEVPVSITAYTAADITDMGITNITNISEMTTNLIIVPTTGGNDASDVCMRGLCRTDFTITEDPMVGIYLDGVYIGKAVGSLFDIAQLERVEVLRGPQGTLYGKNTVGGAVILHTRKPGDEVGGELSLTAGNFGRKDAKAYIEGPLADTLSASLALMSKRHDPFVKNDAGRDIWDEDNLVARTAVRWQPAATVTVDYAYDWQKKRERALVSQLTSVSNYGYAQYLNTDVFPNSPVYPGVPPLAQQVRPKRASHVSVSGPSISNLDVKGHGLTIDWELGDVGTFSDLSLKSITGYREMENVLLNNAFGTWYPRVLSNLPDDFSLKSKSQEFQISGNAFNGYMDFVAGLFYFNEKGDYSNHQVLGTFGMDQIYFTAIDNTSKALFGEVSLHFTDQLTLSLGLRYTDEDREQQHTVTALASPFPAMLGTYFNSYNQTYYGYPAHIPTKINDQGTSPRVALNYQWTDDVMVYASFARGFKSGGFNARSGSLVAWGPYDDMQNDAYEIGVKSMWLDNRVRLNAAVFYQNLTDMQAQVNVIDNGNWITQVQNAAEATIKGFEIETLLKVIDGLDISAGYGYVDAEYDKFMSPDPRLPVGSPAVDVSNDRGFEFTPKHSYNLSLNYTFPQFLPNGDLRARLDWSGMSKHVFTPVLSTNKDIAQDGYSLLNLRLAWEDVQVGCCNDGRLAVAAWVRNLADKEYRIGGYDFDGGPVHGRLATSQYGEPRTYGIDVIYKFGAL